MSLWPCVWNRLFVYFSWKKIRVLRAIWRLVEGRLALLRESSSVIFTNWRESVALWWFPGLHWNLSMECGMLTELCGQGEDEVPEQSCTGQWRTQEFCSAGGGSTNSVEDTGQRDREPGGGSPLVRVSVGSCNLVREISFHIPKFS